MKIPIMKIDNFEADDVIGTIAKQAEKVGYTVYMVTPDKDYGQLVSENIFMYKPSRQGNGVDILGVKEMLAEWEIDRVEQVIDMLGLWVMLWIIYLGVPGIGPKKALNLLKEYGSIENVIANAENIKGKDGEKIRDNVDKALLSKRLATIALDVPITFDEDEYKIDPMDKETLKEIFIELEFRTLAEQILGTDKKQAPKQANLFGDEQSDDNKSIETKSDENAEPKYAVVHKNVTNVNHSYHLIDTKEKRQSLIDLLSNSAVISFDTETTGIDAHQAELVGMVFSIKNNEAYYVPVPADQGSKINS